MSSQKSINKELIFIDKYSPSALKTQKYEKQTAYNFSKQLAAYMDAELNSIWLRWKPSPRPNFNLSLLHDLSCYCNFLTSSKGRIQYNDITFQLDYAILASGVKGVYNVGGDLNLFIELIKSQDFNSLLNYGLACIDVLYRNYIAHELPIITISLVQGQALGGGFEAALSSDVLIAERSAKFGFPEIRFNLFPGMGAYSFLERRIGQIQSESLISSGKVFSAEEMLEFGAIDFVADDGEGENEVINYIRSRKNKKNGFTGVFATRRHVKKLEYEELFNVVNTWAETALLLSERDIKLMQRLASQQNEINS